MASLSRESVLDSFLVYQNSFTLGARFGRWTQEARPCTQDPDARLWTLNSSGHWMLEAELWALNPRLSTLKLSNLKLSKTLEQMELYQ